MNECSTYSLPSVTAKGQWYLGLSWVSMPVSALLEKPEDGAQLTDFVDCLPGVTLQLARVVLKQAAPHLTFLNRCQPRLDKLCNSRQR